MSRSARLLDLIQALRGRRRPVTGTELAESLGISRRTLYRDVATLIAQGAPIEGEAGLGYVLKPGFFLPPLMFDEEEVDAIILGLRLVAQRGDAALAEAADEALAKVAAILPPRLEDAPAESGLLAGPHGAGETPHLAAIRRALRSEEKLRLSYVDKVGRATERTVWPVALGFFEAAEVLAAWCEHRADFRHFRLDRIAAASATGQHYPRRRPILLAEWRSREALD